MTVGKIQKDLESLNNKSRCGGELWFAIDSIEFVSSAAFGLVNLALDFAQNENLFKQEHFLHTDMSLLLRCLVIGYCVDDKPIKVNAGCKIPR